MIKTWLTIILTLAFLTKASALDLIVPASAGGTYHKFASIIADDLEAQGHDVNLIVTGNCVMGIKPRRRRLVNGTGLLILHVVSSSVKKA